MFAVMKKELKTYFCSPVGYVFIGLFLIMFSIFFYVDVFQYGSTNFEYIFYSGATILTFITPILTMRTIAEERKNGTEQLLLTSNYRNMHIFIFWDIKLFWNTSYYNSISNITWFPTSCS